MADFYCKACGTVARPKTRVKGSFLIELALWCCFILPGVLYSVWRLTTKAQVCRACGSEFIIPATSPMAAAALDK